MLEDLYTVIGLCLFISWKFKLEGILVNDFFCNTIFLKAYLRQINTLESIYVYYYTDVINIISKRLVNYIYLSKMLNHKYKMYLFIIFYILFLSYYTKRRKMFYVRQSTES